MTSVGAQLRQARGARQLTLSDVSQRTKIQPWVLEALEADRLTDQMSPVYVKGFLSSYARFLHLPPEPLIAQLVWPQPEEEAVPILVAPKPAPMIVAAPPAISTPKPSTRIPVTIDLPWPLLRRLSGAVVAGLAIWGLVVVNPLRFLPKLSWSRADAPVKTASLAKIKDRVTTAPATPTLALLANQPLELAVTANHTTWIQVKADGKLLTQQRLQRGANEKWTAKKQLELVIAKPSQIDLQLNGQSISPFAIAHQGRLLITHRGVTKLPDAD